MDELAAPPAPARLHLVRVYFSPGARTAWHRHPLGQILYVTEGIGLAQRRGAAPQVIRSGDVVRFAPDEEHWHGAGPEHFMTHLAVHEHAADGITTHWGAHVTDDEYGGVPAGG
jgi:quercetin dioxygenase-like cupin family protein